MRMLGLHEQNDRSFDRLSRVFVRMNRQTDPTRLTRPIPQPQPSIASTAPHSRCAAYRSLIWMDTHMDGWMDAHMPASMCMYMCVCVCVCEAARIECGMPFPPASQPANQPASQPASQSVFVSTQSVFLAPIHRSWRPYGVNVNVNVPQRVCGGAWCMLVGRLHQQF